MATIRSHTYLIGKFVTNTIKSISGQDSGDIVESFASRLAVAAFGYPTAVTINTVAGVPQLIPLSGFAFYPASEFSVVGGAINVVNIGRYTCEYKLITTPVTTANITISLYVDAGSGYQILPLSDHPSEPSAGKRATLNDSYKINIVAANSKLALYVVTEADETLNLSQAYITLDLLPVMKLA